MNGLALDAALTLCLSAGSTALVALNLVVLPAARAPAPLSSVVKVSPPAPIAAKVQLAVVAPAPPAPVSAPGREPVTILEFELASPRVDRRALQALDQTLAQLREAPEIVVVGHADASGPEQLNDRLSTRRAEAVAKRLLGSGIALARIRVEARGEREPREVGNSRRVEIFVGAAP